MYNVVLPPDLEQFAAEAIASGRFRTVDEVVRTGMELLRRREQARAVFVASLEDAQAEAERDGWHSLDDVLAEMDRIIDAAERRAA